jgi:hypothetical protein
LPRATRLLPAGVAVLASFLAFSCGSDGAHTSSAANPAAAGSAPSSFGQRAPAASTAADAAPPASQTGGFDGTKAYEHVAKLVSFGPHPPASAAIQKVQKYIRSQLEAFGCAVDEDDFHAQTPIGTLAMKNIVAKVPGTGQGIILLLTHYDTKRVANFVGAEDSGSSTGLMAAKSSRTRSGSHFSMARRRSSISGRTPIACTEAGNWPRGWRFRET